MIGTVANSSTNTLPRVPALVVGTVLGLLGIAGLTFGLLLPHPLPFVLGALSLAAAAATALLLGTGHRTASAIGGLILAGALLAAPTLVRMELTGSSVAWTAEVGADELSIINGKIYTFTLERSAGHSERTVRLLNPDDGTVEREWSAAALERPSITAEGGVVFATTAVSTSENSKVFTMFGADGHRMWQVPFDTDFDSDVYVTAASAGAVHIVACETADSGSDRQGCRLTTVDDSGEVIDERGIWFERNLSNDQSWSDLPGKLLPSATLVTNLKDEVDMYSPTTVGPIATMPLDTAAEDFGSRLTQEALITAERSSDGNCRLIARSLKDGAQTWDTKVPCTPMTSMHLWATTDDSAPLYLGLDQLDTQKASLLALDTASGTLTTVPESSYRHSRIFPTPAQDLVRDVTAGRFVIAGTGGHVSVSEAGAEDPAVDFEVPGTVDVPAFAAADVLAIVSDTDPTTRADAGEVSPAIRHNPYLVSRWFDHLGDASKRGSNGRSTHFPQCLTVIDASSGRELTSTVFASPITSVTVLPTGQTVAAAEDGTVRVIAASI